jgi:hypothetical protein
MNSQRQSSDKRTTKRNVVNHIDGNPQNNNATNLEWISAQTNYRKSAKQRR